MNDKMIIAIDTTSEREAIKMVEAMDPFTDVYKLGHMLYSSQYFWAVVKYIRAMHKDIFLDLKLWDVPSTVRNTILHLTEDRAFKYITVRYDALSKQDVDKLSHFTELVAVVHLSSNGDVKDAERHWAEFGGDEFADCRGFNAAVVAPSCLHMTLPRRLKKIVPGIRFTSQSDDSHAYTMNPYEAFQKGADQIVIGSAIWKANDPLKQAATIWEDINDTRR
jgi:orotidine-5'-phosphate decarboxylase